MSKQPSSPADRSAAAASSPSASTPPPKNTNKQDCGPIFARWTAVIGNGDVDCATAHAVLNAFQQTDTTRDGAPRYGANIANGWTCDPRYFLRDSVEPHGYSMWCTKEGDTVLTTARGTPGTLTRTRSLAIPHTLARPRSGFRPPQESGSVDSSTLTPKMGHRSEK